jgi:peptidyl-tRNA hydrolase
MFESRVFVITLESLLIIYNEMPSGMFLSKLKKRVRVSNHNGYIKSLYGFPKGFILEP